MELQARFDEAANITQARTLEQAGVHVVYGIVGLKTHAKICLVVRREASGIRRYAHLGTGNYNSSTARLYEDVGLLTADADLGADLTDVFNLLTGYSRQRNYRRLLVAPTTLKAKLIDLIRAEAEAGDGSIVLKMNSLVDADAIDALYEASRAGVNVDLIVRGICCLRPGVPGLSDRSACGRSWPVPGTLADLPPGERGTRLPALHRIGRPDAAEPRAAGGGHGPRRGSVALRTPRPDPRDQPGGRRPRLGARGRRRLDQGGDGSGREPPRTADAGGARTGGDG